MNSKNTQIVIAILAVVGFSTATALVVHHNDTVKSNHAMMVSETMQKEELTKTASDAAMKQAEKDKMAADEAMHKTTTSQ